MLTMGNVYRKLGLVDPAEPLLEESVKIRSSRLGVDHPDTLESRTSLAWLFVEQGRYDDAEQQLLELVEVGRRSPRGRDPGVGDALYGLAGLAARRSESERALDYLSRAVESGYSDLAHIEEDPDLDSLRDSQEFRKIIARIHERTAERAAPSEKP